MSLWTPSGEHPVGRSRPNEPASTGRQATPGAAESEADVDQEGAPSLDDLSPEERAQVEEYAQRLEEARRRVLERPAGPVVAEQALQFYELAALHLSQPEPRLDDARVAIDALAAVIDAVGSRLGEAETPLRQALNQLQVAFVDLARNASDQQDST